MTYYTIKQMAMRYPISVSTLRKMAANPEKYGLEEVVYRLKNLRRVFFHDAKFERIMFGEGLEECMTKHGNEDKSITYNRPNFEALLNDEDLYASEIESESDKKDDDESDNEEPSFGF